LEQIIDVGLDPTAKERLLSGRVNLITCPQCGYRGMVGTPLVYHDAAKQMAIIYVPMELNLEQSQREKLIGDFTNALIRALPEDAPKGYLLQPHTALTLQGLIDQILEADGISPEMLDAERKKVDLVRQIIAAADDQEVAQLISDNQPLLDLTFLELLTAAAQSASQSGDSRQSLKLLNLRSQLMDSTEAGQELKAQEAALNEAAREVEALGQNITREAFAELLVNAVNNPAKVDALATLGRNLLDYTTFQLITEQIEKSEGESRTQLEAMRNRLLEINAEYERQARALIQRSTDTLKMLLQAPDVAAAIRNNLDRIDDMFLQVLQLNLDEARKAGHVEVSSKLKQVRDEVLKLIQASAPPEVRLINDLLALENENEALEALRTRKAEVNDNLLAVMDELINQLGQAGNDPAVQRLEALKLEAQRLS
jgi:hypothetical protein